MPKEKVLLYATLGFLIRPQQVLLALKAGKIGAGCRNGHGGGFYPEKGETPEQGMIQEFSEEAEIIILPRDLEKVAIVQFHNTTTESSTFTCEVHVYLAQKWQGEPQSTKEMKDPQWFDINALPFSQLMPADPFWLPLVLQGKKIKAEAWYGPFQKEILKAVSIVEVDSLP